MCIRDRSYTACDLSNREIVDVGELSAYADLTRMVLSQNSISTLPDLKQCTNLQKLVLDDNAVSEFGEALATLPSLRELSVRNNAVAGELAGLPASLHSLDLSGNQLVVLTGLEELAEMTSLDLSANKLNSNLAGLSCAALEHVKLSGNKLTSTEGIEGAPALKTADLSGNRLESIVSLGETHEALTSLDLKDNKIAAFSGIECLGSLPALEELNLNGNPIQQESDYKRRVISMLPTLKVIDGEDILKEERAEVLGWQAAETARLEALEAEE
eukprot:TRINITY_DN5016_c0_g1_i4.p1 TRINITY_DN5016_c0_g1~~TRINITY_DN5016_c0_g1_i4.p1  ORF type:complete len:272 (+),score=107.24 TRINITY_DN5016_c0_g1_i4:95-910(+)